MSWRDIVMEVAETLQQTVDMGADVLAADLQGLVDRLLEALDQGDVEGLP